MDNNRNASNDHAQTAPSDMASPTKRQRSRLEVDAQPSEQFTSLLTSLPPEILHRIVVMMERRQRKLSNLRATCRALRTAANAYMSALNVIESHLSKGTRVPNSPAAMASFTGLEQVTWDFSPDREYFKIRYDGLTIDDEYIRLRAQALQHMPTNRLTLLHVYFGCRREMRPFARALAQKQAPHLRELILDCGMRGRWNLFGPFVHSTAPTLVALRITAGRLGTMALAKCLGQGAPNLEVLKLWQADRTEFAEQHGEYPRKEDYDSMGYTDDEDDQLVLRTHYDQLEAAVAGCQALRVVNLKVKFKRAGSMGPLMRALQRLPCLEQLTTNCPFPAETLPDGSVGFPALRRLKLLRTSKTVQPVLAHLIEQQLTQLTIMRDAFYTGATAPSVCRSTSLTHLTIDMYDPEWSELTFGLYAGDYYVDEDVADGVAEMLLDNTSLHEVFLMNMFAMATYMTAALLHDGVGRLHVKKLHYCEANSKFKEVAAELFPEMQVLTDTTESFPRRC